MNIKLTIRGIEQLTNLAASLYQHVARVIRDEALPLIRDTWAATALSSQLSNKVSTSTQSEYAAALQQPEALEYPVGGDPYYGRVIITNPAVIKAEVGRPARDMKPSLLGGPKARRGKKGQRYNIIPIGFSTESGFDAWQFHGVSPFRAVSDFSPASSWWYPAIPGVAARDTTIAIVTPQLQALLQRSIAEWHQ